MSLYRAVMFLIPIIIALSGITAQASVQNSSSPALKIRAWNHAKYLRIVMEGPSHIISKGTVSHEDNNVYVDFSDADFHIQKKKLPVEYRQEKNTLIISLKKPSSLKTFSLKNPSRLVVDVYDRHSVKKRRAVKKKKTAKEVNNGNDKARAREKKKETHEAQKDTKKAASRHKLAKENKEKTARKTQRKNTPQKSAKKDKSGDSFVPDQYKGLWGLLQAGNFYTVLKELPNFKPGDVKSLAAYHYMYGDAYRTAQQNLDAIKHLRLAYLYAADEELKERALFERAELYKKMRLVYEARANYLVFIDKYPSSERLSMAHLGLAETLSEMEMYNDAVEHYRKAGNAPEILFSKANALQRTGRVSEARKAYAEALAVDSKYPSKSPETYFFIGENMRMLGELGEAKRHLRALSYGPFKDNARLSLGHIAMEEKNIKEAITNFKEAANSSDRNVRIEGLFYLSRALVKDEKTGKALESLETIRSRYINSERYKDTLLELAILYRETGKLEKSVSLLKELVYGKNPPKEAFKELESIILAAGKKKDDTSGNITFVTLWNEVGQWLIDETRAEFLIKVSEKLRSEGQSFIKLSTWLVENTTKDVRGRAAVDLSDYYTGIGNIDEARKYMEIAKKADLKGDALLRVEARILYEEHEYRRALGKLMDIRKFRARDLDQVGAIITKLEKSDERLEAVAFYETILNSNEWEADNYNRMADILYTNDEKDKALKYYRIALQKRPEDQWAAYRVGDETGGNESREMFERIRNADSLLGRLARTKIKELELLNKVKEVY